MLESVSTFMGIVHVSMTEGAYNRCVSPKAEGMDYAAYNNFESSVKNATLVQFGGDKIKDVVVDNAKNTEDAAKQVAAEFLSYQEKAEQGRK